MLFYLKTQEIICPAHPKKKGLSQIGQTLEVFWYLGRELNSYKHYARGILSPLRLPVPPPRHNSGLLYHLRFFCKPKLIAQNHHQIFV